MNIHNEVNSDDYMILFTLLCFKTSATEYLINHINLRLSYTNSTGTLPFFLLGYLVLALRAVSTTRSVSNGRVMRNLS